MKNTKNTLRTAQQRGTIQITPNGAVAVNPYACDNKDHTSHKKTPLTFTAHLGVARSIDIAPILETALETVKNTGVEMVPVVAPVIAVATAAALAHAVIKHGHIIAFNSLKTSLKDSFSGPNTNSRLSGDLISRQHFRQSS